MGRPAHKCAEEICDLLEKAGVGTYFFVFMDPDSRSEIYTWTGSKPWLAGALHLKLDALTRLYNSGDEGDL